MSIFNKRIYLGKQQSNDIIPDAIIERYNNNGSIIECPYFDNKTLKLFVADAKHRAAKTYYTAYQASLSAFNKVENSYDFYLSSTEDNRINTADPPRISIAQLIQMWSTNHSYSLKNAPLASKYKTMPYASGQSMTGNAITYLDSLNLISGKKMCIPNEFELMVIFLCMNAIDALDPTVDSYPQWALGNKKGIDGKRWNFDGNRVAYSSTIGSLSNASGGTNQLRCVNHAGYCGLFGCYTRITPATIPTRGIIPVYELEIA